MKHLFLIASLLTFSSLLPTSRSLNIDTLQTMDPELLKLIIAYYQRTGELPQLLQKSDQQKQTVSPSAKASEANFQSEKKPCKNCCGKHDKKDEKQQNEKAAFLQAATGLIGGFANVVAGTVTANPSQMITGVGGIFSSAVQAVTHRSPHTLLHEKRPMETSPSVPRR